MHRAIVTGATSMLGVSLIEECINNSTPVVAIVRPFSKNIDRLPKSDLITIVECDMTSYKDISKQIEFGKGVFYHFAWSSADRSRNDDLLGQVKNIQYTLDALNSAKGIGCELFVGVGSQAEYGDIKNEIMGPLTIPNPDTPYGICKYAASKLAMIQSERLGIGYIWTRVFSVFGEYDHIDSMISSTLRKIKVNKPTEFTDGKQMWDYLNSKDAGRAFYLVGKKGIPNSIYCIASGQSLPLSQYIQLIGKITNPNYELGIGKIDKKNMKTRNLFADIQNLVDDTGFEPSVSFEDGIRMMWGKLTKNIY